MTAEQPPEGDDLADGAGRSGVRGGWAWLFALLPLLPVLFSVGVHRLSAEERAGIVNLSGTWKALEDPQHEVALDVDTSSWRELEVPGGYSAQGFKAHRAIARRTFELPPAFAGEDLYFMLGTVRDGFVRVYVNGHPIGEKGVGKTLFRQEQASVDGFPVSGALVHEGENTVELAFYYPNLGFDGVADGRVFLGVDSVLRPYFEKNESVKHFLEYGGLMAVLFAGAIIAFLAWLQREDEERRRLYRSTLIMLLGVAFYLVGKTGFAVSSFLDAEAANTIIVNGITLIGFGVCEFVEDIYLRRVTVLRKVNRVICGATLIVSVVLALPVYGLFAPYLSVIVLYAVVLAMRGLLKRDVMFAPVLAAAVLGLAATGINDLLTDLHIVYSPRLFTFASANMGLVSTIVVITDFLGIAQQNQVLSAALARRNLALQDALRQAEESARLKSEFLANTSHELRTPLNAIINIPQGLIEAYGTRNEARCGACEARFALEADEVVDDGTRCPSCGEVGGLSTQVQHIGGPSADDSVRYLSRVVRSGKHLLAVVNDILDFSKLEANRTVLALEPLDAREVVREVYEAQEPPAVDAGLRLELRAPEHAVALVADPVKLAQIALNLVSNAIKFSERGGTVRVSLEDGPEEVCISVADEGIGIAAEDQELVFESFRQVDGGHTRRYGGTGLGLAITKGLIEMHGGSISLESAMGEGSTFVVRLPKRGPEREAPLADATGVEGDAG